MEKKTITMYSDTNCRTSISKEDNEYKLAFKFEAMPNAYSLDQLKSLATLINDVINDNVDVVGTPEIVVNPVPVNPFKPPLMG